jgi:linoleoyl-CoA desaturase
MSSISYKFSNSINKEFGTTLKQRVNDYFRSNNISKNANWRMVVKTVVMLAIYFVPFGFLLSGAVTNLWLVFACWIMMGVGMSGIGFSIMHDANHGAYSKNKYVNNTLSYLLNFVGGNVANWRIQHNKLHHTFTNIDGADHDLDSPGALRFSPHKELKKIHKYQHLYAWFFYSLLTLNWATVKEFDQITRYRKMNLVRTDSRYRKILIGLVFWKLFYFAYALALPIYLIPVPWWITVIGFVVMHLVSGLITSTIFQAAHVMSHCEFPLPDESGKLENNWMAHQIATTANFAPKNWLLSYYIGGLNFQVEHHLFPNICHIHYKHISKIVKETAEQFNLPYHSEATFRRALAVHTQTLKKFGQPAV